jgi:hypothetical protein
MDINLAHRCARLPESVRGSRTKAYFALLNAGWNKDLPDRDLDAALAWAGSQVLTAKQEKFRRQRSAKKEHLKADDALDLMFRAAGADPTGIPRRKGVL